MSPSLLFARGPGKVKEFKKDKKAKKSKPKPKKHRKFGDESDNDDETFIPNGARRSGNSQKNKSTGKWELYQHLFTKYMPADCCLHFGNAYSSS
jgi:hypothetical protein